MATQHEQEFDNNLWYKRRCDIWKRHGYRLLKRKYGWPGIGWHIAICDRMRELDDDVYKLRIDDEETYGELQEFLGIDKQELLDQFIEDCVEKYKLFAQADGYLWSIEIEFDRKANEEVRRRKRDGALKTNQKRWGARNNDTKSVADVISGIGNRNGNDRSGYR